MAKVIYVFVEVNDKNNLRLSKSLDPEEQFEENLSDFRSGVRASSRPRQSTAPQRRPKI